MIRWLEQRMPLVVEEERLMEDLNQSGGGGGDGGLIEPPQELVLPVTRLEAWLRGQDKRVLGGAGGKPLTSVQLCSHGQSNPTYLLGFGREGTRLVLRKKPVGKLLKSAHAIEREYVVMEKLRRHTPFPVPAVLTLERDSAIIGTPFYLMECIEGRLAKDPTMPGVPPHMRKRIWLRLAETLGELHTISPAAIGLSDFSKRPKGYSARVLRRWAIQYAQSSVERKGGGEGLAEMKELERRLKDMEEMILEREGPPVLVHGDYRLDNVVFRKDSLEVAAVLDWELATLGDAFSDLATLCLCFHVPDGVPSFANVSQGKPSGTPCEWDIIRHYAHVRRISLPSSEQWSFYMGLALYKMAAILDGVGARASFGAGAAPNAALVGSVQVVAAFASNGLQLMSSLTPSPSKSLSHLSKSVSALLTEVVRFIDTEIIPSEKILDAHAASDLRWTIHPKVEELKSKAMAQGLWNLWIPHDLKKIMEIKLNGVEIDGGLGQGLSNLEYLHIAAATGRSLYASESFNCSAPDTGNMDILARFGTPAHCRKWLVALLRGKKRSAFLMTEPDVASSDATNVSTKLTCDTQGSLAVTGKKWWSSGALDPRCELCLCLCRDERVTSSTLPSPPRHRQHTIVMFSIQAPGVEVLRHLPVFGFDDSPHGHAEVALKNVPVRNEDVLGEKPGSGFEVAQSRLGPGRLHHCGRLIGGAERCLAVTVKRAKERKTFGKLLAEHGMLREKLARARIGIEGARLQTLQAAAELDEKGPKGARRALAIAKVAVPEMAQYVADVAIQIHGGGGLSNDYPLAKFFASARTLRIADGPDEVHLESIAKIEIGGKPRL